MKSRFVIIVLMASLTGMGTYSRLFAAEIDGSNFNSSYTAHKITLPLVGVGLLRYWGFKAYTGAFYLEQGVSIKDALSDVAKRIEVEYRRPFKGKDFGPATEKIMMKNVNSENFERLRPRLDHHGSLYEDVQPGDRYSLTYIPGVGTELALNGEPKGIIKGAEFAAALFSVWIGPKPINQSFKEQILSNAERRGKGDTSTEKAVD